MLKMFSKRINQKETTRLVTDSGVIYTKDGNVETIRSVKDEFIFVLSDGKKDFRSLVEDELKIRFPHLMNDNELLAVLN
ncbi:MAG: hypothetical protein ACH0QD_13235 [Tepidibacillus sp.]